MTAGDRYEPFDQYDTDREAPVIRDKRRLDPETGQVRESSEQAATPEVASPDEAAPGAPAADAASGLEAQLAERTADLQRLQAEYANYRRRVERDRESIRQLAVTNVLMNLLPVVDDIGRARDHGELEGGFKSVADALESSLDKLGLKPFGSEGDSFDPMVHEALTHTHSEEVTQPTCVRIFQPGYRIGERVVRPARVAVADPAAGSDTPAEPADPSEAVEFPDESESAESSNSTN